MVSQLLSSLLPLLVTFISDSHPQAQPSALNDDEANRIRLIQSIRILTSFLHGYNSGEERPVKQTRPGDIHSFIQLANLLTLDAPILAVTGTVSADAWITGIVIASSPITRKWIQGRALRPDRLYLTTDQASFPVWKLVEELTSAPRSDSVRAIPVLL